jgi:glycosyltransferase involved in cell wall biosynthesis
VRILYAVHKYPPYIGGSEEVSRRIVEHMVEVGHDVTVATVAHPRRPEQPGNPTIRSFAHMGTRLWPDIPSAQRAEAESYRSLFEQEWDLRFIYAAQNWTLNAVWDLVGHSDAADVLAPCGYSWLGTPGSDSYFDLIAQLLPKFAAVIYHSDEYQDYYFARDRDLLANAVIIPNGTELPPRSAGDKQSERGPVTVATVGSHVRSKGHADFTRACRRTGLPGVLVAPRPAVTRERLRGCYYQCVARTSLSSGVRLVEGSAPGVVDSVLAEAQMFFLPSKVETAPLVILEAMARSVPWVSYDVGMVHALPGGLVVADLDEAVDALRSLASDADRRRALAAAGREAIERKYRWGLVLPRYEAVLRAAAGAP